MTFVLIFLTVSTISGCSKRDAPTGPSPGTTYTILQGHIAGTLAFAQSPYKAVSDLIVDSLSILNVDPDVRIFFENSTQLLVRGQIVCAGSRFHPILFSSSNVFWKGIQIINSTQPSLLQFTIVEHVDLPAAGDDARNGTLEIANANITVRNSIFRNNKAHNGGAISLDSSRSLITNNLFHDNFAGVFGGAIVSATSSNQFINNTFYNNYAFNYGGGLVVANAVLDEVQSNIFYRNTSSTVDPGIFYFQTDSTHFLSQFNFLQSGSVSPLFFSTTNFHLNVSSPCIDAGNPASQFNDVDGTRNDQGAYGGPLGDW